jgi:transitional endoplasmic reticulum ATPase
MGITNVGSKGNSIADLKAADKVVVAKVERYGTNLVVPEGMKLADAAQVIKRAMEADEMVVGLNEDFNCFVLEGAYALKLALEELYGWVDIQPTPGFFGDNPPQLVGVQINEAGDTVQVPWGRFLCPVIPKADGFLQSGVDKGPKEIGLRRFRLMGEIKQKYKEEFQKLCGCVRKHLKSSSIYKGKAISIKFIDPNTNLPYPMPTPKFIRLDSVSKANLIFPEDVEAAVRTNLFTPIEHTAQVRAAGIPLKRGILLAGNFGTGKTLAAYVAAKLAVDHGHTFIYAESIEEFNQVMEFARLYAEAGKISIVFCEDIDKLLKGERSISMDQVLNILDGVDGKRHEVMSVFTTNDVEQVHQAAVRPGRIDAIIHVQRPDAEAAIRLIRLYAGDKLPPTEDLTRVGEELAGNIPAVIRECVERSKLYAIGLGEFEHLTTAAMLASAKTMKMQLDLLEEKREITPSEMAVFGQHMGSEIAQAIRWAMEGYEFLVDSKSDDAPVIESVVSNLTEASNHAGKLKR